MTSAPLPRVLTLLHGGFYVLTGIWPVLHLPSFIAFVGPKKEGWLVKTVGALLTVIGSVLVLAGLRQRPGPEFPLLAVGTATALATVDIVYARRKVIGPVFLLDAAWELTLIAAWLVALRRR